MILPEPEEIRVVNAENTFPEAKKQGGRSDKRSKGIEEIKTALAEFLPKTEERRLFPALWKRETLLFL